MRVLSVVRLSADRDQSTSPERQREHNARKAADIGGEVVAVAEDLAVSATKFSPFKRPDLGRYLTDPVLIDSWDTLIVWRLDRLVRSSSDLSEFLTWCTDHGKRFISATEGFDLGTPFGKAMVTIIAALAELEAATVKLRVTDAHAKLKTMNRWASGVPPLGFKAVPHPSGKGVGLDTDPDGKALLHEMASRLLSGWSYTRIAAWLNETGALTAMDRARVAKGEEPHKAPWNIGNVRRILTSPATQGFKVTRNKSKTYDVGTVVLDKNGEAIRMAPPTFDDETWEQIQQANKQRSANGKRRTHSPNPMLGIGFCRVCGASLAQQFTKESEKQFERRKAKDPTAERKTYRAYRCGRTPKACPKVSITASEADKLVEAVFLRRFADQRVKEKRFVPGTDNRAEIEQLRENIQALSASLATAGSAYAREALSTQLDAAGSRLEALEAEPYRPSRWEDVELDQTYAEAWQQCEGVEERRELVKSSGFVFVLGRKGEGNRIALGMRVGGFDATGEFDLSELAN